MVLNGVLVLLSLFKIIVADDRFLSNATNQHSSLPEIREGDTCVPGNLYKIECNTCRCTTDRSLMCTKMACIDWKSINENAEKALRDGNGKSKILLPQVQKGLLCKAGKLYRYKCKRCFCTNENKIVCSMKQNNACIFDKLGNPIPINIPEDVSPTLHPKDVERLPALTSSSEKCDPGKFYKLDCNFCVCLVNGNLLCQQKLCVSYEDMNKMDAIEMSGKSCSYFGKKTIKNCKSCTCVGGKTNCHVIPGCSQNRKKLAGPSGLPHDYLEPGKLKGKCIPKAIYKVNCNKCYCQTDASLRCTQKTCLNYTQVKLLEKQRAYLEKHGL